MDLVTAYVRAYVVHRRHPSDAFYAWRCWDAREALLARCAS